MRLAEFGRKLFFDTRLSANGSVACANCHQPALSFTDGLPISKGIGTTTRNAPTIINTHMANWFFWDGRADSLAAQAIGPLLHADEHGLTPTLLVNLLKQHHSAEYNALFGPWPTAKNAQTEPLLPPPASHSSGSHQVSPEGTAYMLATIGPHHRLTELLKQSGRANLQPSRMIATALGSDDDDDLAESDAIVLGNIATAIESWESLQIANRSSFDEFASAVAQQPETPLAETATRTNFSPDALAGLRLFTGPGNCTLCHNGPLLSDQQFHNIGLGDHDRQQELKITGWLKDVAGRFKGLASVKESNWNCTSSVWDKTSKDRANRTLRESCRQLEYLAMDNVETIGAFKTPTLRNVALTGPYFHDGRAKSLDEVLDHYSKLDAAPVIGHREESLIPLRLNDEERRALKAFLESLSSPVSDLSIR
jgi:cytochrome c peroxidase